MTDISLKAPHNSGGKEPDSCQGRDEIGFKKTQNASLSHVEGWKHQVTGADLTIQNRTTKVSTQFYKLQC